MKKKKFATSQGMNVEEKQWLMCCILFIVTFLGYSFPNCDDDPVKTAHNLKITVPIKLNKIFFFQIVSVLAISKQIVFFGGG